MRAVTICALGLLLAGPVGAGPVGAGPARAQAPAAPSVVVTDAWSRATPPGAHTGAVYLTLTSPGGDKLLGVSSPASNSASLHAVHMQGDMMRMRELPDGLDLPAGGAVTLRPGGDHIMLMGLNAPLKQGQEVPVRLTFLRSAPLEVQARVAGLGATAAPGTRR